MPCDTCFHTMQNLGVEPPADAPYNAVFWCPRCGTIKSRRSGSPEEFISVSVPFWTQRAPHTGFVVVDGRLYECGQADNPSWREFFKRAVEEEVSRRLSSRPGG